MMPDDDHLRSTLEAVAKGLDQVFNKGEEREIGFVVLVFPYNDKSGRCNYISNGASRHDIIRMFKFQINRLRERIHEERHRAH